MLSIRNYKSVEGEEAGSTPALWPWLWASVICTAFGPGFQCIPILALLQPFFLLRFCAEARERKVLLVAASAAQALGTAVAYAGIFNDPSWT